MQPAHSRDGAGADCARNAGLYDQLERALISLTYALADARVSEQSPPAELDRIVRSHEALQSAGAEVQVIMLALQSAGLRSAAERARQWG
jgi:hypothetical protein